MSSSSLISVELPAGYSKQDSKYLAYKGFNKDLKCRNEQFEIGKEYRKENEALKPRLCTIDGWHYCDTLNEVFSYYPENGSRFCVIEITGNYTKHPDKKNITTAFKIIKEISKEEIFELAAEENMKLDVIRKLQTRFPLLQVGGSIALFLYGIRLIRYKTRSSDIDLCLPYWQNLKDCEGVKFGELSDIQQEKFYNNDFQETLVVEGMQCDLRIDPKQHYTMVEYKGFNYRCAPFEVIMEAKFRYALRGNLKHKDDVNKICFPKLDVENIEPELPW